MTPTSREIELKIVALESLEGFQRLIPQIDTIFFAASATRSFADEAARQAFRERWLGRYFEHFGADTLVALDGGGRVLGYLVGARRDPAGDPLFADIGYFADLSDLTARYPAHLHVNLAEDARGRGVGTRLVAAFCRRLDEAGSPGVHVVTGANSRNRSFYDRMGFQELRVLNRDGAAIVMLGRALPTSGAT
jgi:GNAT superfamily N-acetyltransferase